MDVVDWMSTSAMNQPGVYHVADSSSNQGDNTDTSSTTIFESEKDGYYDGEDEQSALQYARECGLCEDFLLEHPYQADALTYLPWNTERDFDDPKGVIRVEEIDLTDLTRERLLAEKETLLVLQKVVIPDEKRQPLDGLPDIARSKSLKVELPLLCSDHEMDMKAFCNRGDREIRLCDLSLPMEHVDSEKDESMEWPVQCKKLPAEALKSIESERLQVPKEIAKYILDVMLAPPLDDGHEQLHDEFESHEKKREKQVKSITPPLVPMLSPVLVSFDPSSDTGRLPLLSDGTDMIAEEMAAIEHRLQHDDRLHMPGLNSSDEQDPLNTDVFVHMYPQLHSDLASVEASPRPKRKVSDLKLEPPLIASDDSTSSSIKKRKTVSFAEEISTYITEIPPSRPIEQLDLASEESMEAFFKDVVEPLAMEATRAAEQEQLVAADSLQRVDVPVMDFSYPTAPWNNQRQAMSKTAKAANVLDMWHDIGSDLSADMKAVAEYGSWKISAKTERQLQPYPFDAELGKTKPEQGIDDGRYIAVILSDLNLEDVIRSDDLVWKREGLSISRRPEYEIDEELDPLQLEEEEPERNDMAGLLLKCQQEYEKTVQKKEGSIVSPQMVVQGARIDGNESMITPQVETRLAQGQNAQSFLDSHLATANSLHAFMNNNMGRPMQFEPKTRIEDYRLPESAKTPSPMEHTDLPPSDPIPPAEMMRPTVPFGLPQMPEQLPERAVVLSVGLLQTHRRVLRIVFKDLYPNASHIERDFFRVPEASEADMIVSPGTGIIFTTLQKIKQKALPGQADLVRGVRKQIVQLALRYERLIVLVGDAMAEAATNLDQRDCEAMADFVTFCAQCKTEVFSHFVPLGDENMAAWVAAIIHEHGDTGQEISLLPEETVWEQTLRRVGLNAYAAQAVLASVKSNDEPTHARFLPSQSTHDFGIRAFLNMSPKQRIRQFADILGGARVLNRVNKVLEQQWLSAKTGY